MANVLRHDIPEFMQNNQLDEQLFLKRAQNAFDFRVNVIAAYVAERIQYKTRAGRDPWKFPGETLFVGKGDSEDIAFLLASLMLAAGIAHHQRKLV